MNIIKFFFLSFLALLLSNNASEAQVVLVGNRSFENIKLSKDETVNILLMRNTTINNKKIKYIDLKKENEEINEFLKHFDLSIVEVRKVWMKNIFSGKVDLPISVSSFEEVKAKIIETPNSIGFLPKNMIDKNVVILFEE